MLAMVVGTRNPKRTRTMPSLRLLLLRIWKSNKRMETRRLLKVLMAMMSSHVALLRKPLSSHLLLPEKRRMTMTGL